MAKERMTSSAALGSLAAALLCLLLTGVPLGTAIAQNATTAGREQMKEQARDAQGEMLREQIRERIESEQGLQEQDRERLRQNLAECVQLRLGDDVTDALFAEGEPLKNQIRVQERVLVMAREGLPVQPVVGKLQEGRRKGASGPVVEKACERMEANVRTANRILMQAREDGVRPETPDAEQRHTREMAGYMWSGLQEADMEQLRERARLRLRDGACTTGDLTAAAETASRLHEMNVERQRAVGLAGEALQNGYTAQEMQQLRWMVMTAYMHGVPRNEVLDTLERGLRYQHELTYMMREMQRQGWMGPADAHGGRGAMSPDNTSGSGPGGAHHDDDKGHGGGGQGGSGGGGQDGNGGGGNG